MSQIAKIIMPAGVCGIFCFFNCNHFSAAISLTALPSGVNIYKSVLKSGLNIGPLCAKDYYRITKYVPLSSPATHASHMRRF